MGNHEVALLWALRDPTRVGFWMSIGGQEHDLAELTRDPALQSWLRERPALVRLHDGTLIQHCGHDGYSRWMKADASDPSASIVARARDLSMQGGDPELWEVLTPPKVFNQQPNRLQQRLQPTNIHPLLSCH